MCFSSNYIRLWIDISKNESTGESCGDYINHEVVTCQGCLFSQMTNASLAHCAQQCLEDVNFTIHSMHRLTATKFLLATQRSNFNGVSQTFVSTLTAALQSYVSDVGYLVKRAWSVPSTHLMKTATARALCAHHTAPQLSPDLERHSSKAAAATAPQYSLCTAPQAERLTPLPRGGFIYIAV